MHDLDTPMAPVDAQERFGRGVGGLQAGDQIDDFYFWRFPGAMLPDLPRARDATNMFYARPVFLDASGLGG